MLSFLGPLGEWGFVSLFAGQEEDLLTLTYLYTEIWTLLCFTSFGFLLGYSNNELESIAFHDALTGVFSRGLSDGSIQRAFGSPWPLSTVFQRHSAGPGSFQAGQ